MRVNGWLGVSSGGLLARVAAPVVAHHSFAAEFDINRPIKLDGVVTKMQFSNPHSWLHIEVTTGERREAAMGGRRRRAERVDPSRLEPQLGAGRHQGARRRVPSEGPNFPRERPRHHVARRLVACSWARAGRRRRAPNSASLRFADRTTALRPRVAAPFSLPRAMRAAE